jgi:glutamine amidotransferase
VIGLINFGHGNLQSVINAFDNIDIKCEVVDKPIQIKSCGHLILPGVGSFKTCMDVLIKNKWDENILEYLDKKKPFLGICLGMQLLFSWGEEDGGCKGLDVISGKVSKIKIKKSEKLPHIGWNSIKIVKKSPIFEKVNEKVDYYFVHSYECIPKLKENILALANYGENNNIVVSVTNNLNVFGTQFHPEKSPPNGLRILKNFINIK